MKYLNWNDLSELGLIIKINHEILHPLGLAISRNPDDGSSAQILIADDGVWEYPEPVTAFLENTSTADFRTKIDQKINDHEEY